MRSLLPPLALLLLCGCGATPRALTTPTPAPPTATPLPTPTQQAVHRDCGWGGWGEAWLDANENGIQDADERPMPGVAFAASGGGVSAYRKTGVDSRVFLDSGLRDCPIPMVWIYGTAPPGYRLTTADSIPDHGYDSPYRFGVAPIARASATATRGATPTRTVTP